MPVSSGFTIGRTRRTRLSDPHGCVGPGEKAQRVGTAVSSGGLASAGGQGPSFQLKCVAAPIAAASGA